MFLDKGTVVDVHKGEMVTALLLLEELDMVTEDIGIWIEHCDVAEAALALLRKEMQTSATNDHLLAVSC